MKDDFINKVHISFVFGKNVNKVSAISESNYLYDKYVAAAIERAFSEFHDRKNVSIERIQIDLGEVSRDELEEKVYLALFRRLNDCSSGVVDPEMSYAASEKTETAEFIGDQSDSQTKFSGEILSDRKFSLFREYLLKQKFPWYVDSSNDSDHSDDSEIEKHIQHVLSSIDRLETFLRSLDAVSYLCFMGMLSTADILEIMKRVMSTGAGKDVLVERIYGYILQKYVARSECLSDMKSRTLPIADQRIDLSFSGVHTAVEQDRQLMIFSIAQILKLQVPYYDESISLLKSVFLSEGLLRDAGVQYQHRVAEGRRSQNQETTSEDIVDFHDVLNEFENLLYGNLLKETKETVKLEDKEVQERLLVEDAGIVLLSPWFVNLFEACGYLDEHGEFKSIVSRMRAVHLLEYLSGCRGKHYDYRLSLCKIICGLPTGFPMDSEFNVLPKEEEECNALLEMAIDYWPSLKGSTVYALQETFLMRRGLLEKNENDWIVRIEPKTLDILMDDLPWGFSVISSQWNEYLIYVEWKRS